MANHKILVVDDSPTDLRLAMAPLQARGYTVITASDGEEALAKATNELPNVVVLDIVMPKKNGFQVCRQIKTGQKTRQIKVILLSSRNQEADRFWGIKQGADVYMTKPVDNEDLLANIERLLQ